MFIPLYVCMYVFVYILNSIRYEKFILVDVYNYVYMNVRMCVHVRKYHL